MRDKVAFLRKKSNCKIKIKKVILNFFSQLWFYKSQFRFIFLRIEHLAILNSDLFSSTLRQKSKNGQIYIFIPCWKWAFLRICYSFILNCCLPSLSAGVAVWRQYGGAPVCSSSSHRTHKETIQQRHWLLCQAERAAGSRSLDGWV